MILEIRVYRAEIPLDPFLKRRMKFIVVTKRKRKK